MRIASIFAIVKAASAVTTAAALLLVGLARPVAIEAPTHMSFVPGSTLDTTSISVVAPVCAEDDLCWSGNQDLFSTRGHNYFEPRRAHVDY